MTILEDLKAGRLVVVPRDGSCKHPLQVEIKPLEWRGSSSDSPVGEYIARKDFFAGEDAPWDLNLDGMGIGGVYASLREAKAAAQADYEARILSALSAAPDHTTALLSLVEGMERERDEAEVEADHFAKLACDDLGKNPPVFWKERALAAEAKVEALREALADAAEAIEHWGTYASSYLQEKHDWAGDIARARALTQEQNNG